MPTHAGERGLGLAAIAFIDAAKTRIQVLPPPSVHGAVLRRRSRSRRGRGSGFGLRDTPPVLLAGEDEGCGAKVVGRVEGRHDARVVEKRVQASLLPQPGRLRKWGHAGDVRQRWIAPSSQKELTANGYLRWTKHENVARRRGGSARASRGQSHTQQHLLPDSGLSPETTPILSILANFRRMVCAAI